MPTFDWVLLDKNGIVDRFENHDTALIYCERGMRVEFSPEPVVTEPYNPFDRDQTYKED
jgi:hypothetical protein